MSQLEGRTGNVEAVVPLRMMFDYADKVRSLSQGRANSTLEPHSYAPAPDDVLRGFLNPDAIILLVRAREGLVGYIERWHMRIGIDLPQPLRQHFIIGCALISGKGG